LNGGRKREKERERERERENKERGRGKSTFFAYFDELFKKLATNRLHFSPVS